jgi:hypothetical protein
MDLLKLASYLELKLNDSSLKLEIINQFKKFCMRCFSSSSTEKMIKTYKDNKVFPYLNVKHLEHIVCNECDKQKTK